MTDLMTVSIGQDFKHKKKKGQAKSLSDIASLLMGNNPQILSHIKVKAENHDDKLWLVVYSDSLNKKAYIRADEVLGLVPQGWDQ